MTRDSSPRRAYAFLYNMYNANRMANLFFCCVYHWFRHLFKMYVTPPRDKCHTYPWVKKAFSVNPVRVVATAMRKVTNPKVAWTGTSAALRAAVLASQHNRIRKLKKPTTSYTQKEKHILQLYGILYSLHTLFHSWKHKAPISISSSDHAYTSYYYVFSGLLRDDLEPASIIFYDPEEVSWLPSHLQC